MNIALTMFSLHRFGSGEVIPSWICTVQLVWLVQSDPMRVALEAGSAGCSRGEELDLCFVWIWLKLL